MNSFYKINVVCILLFFCLCASATQAQLASDKSLNEIYNKKIREKLDQKDNNKNQLDPLQRPQNVASANPGLKNMASRKIKNPEIVAHAASVRSGDENKNKLPSNSSKLKQLGKPDKLKKLRSQ